MICTSLLHSVPVWAEAGSITAEKAIEPDKLLNEFSIGSGYIWGALKRTPGYIAVYPAFVRVGFNMTSFVGLEGGQSTLQLALEPFVNSIAKPEHGIETGCSAGLRFLQKLNRPCDIFVEASVAPMYLGIDTLEQEKAGFNFLCQAGVGFQYKLSSKNAVFAGYRLRHISHTRFIPGSNAGINSDGIVAGISWFY